MPQAQALFGGTDGRGVPSAQRYVAAFFEWFGEFGHFCARLARAAVSPPYEFRELLRQMDSVGSLSLPLVALAGAATGVVMSLQTRFDYDAKQIFAKPDTAKLKDTKALDEAGQFLQQNKFGLVVISASAGMKGDSDKERGVTEAQAMVVRNYLVNHFETDDTRVRTRGAGKTPGTSDAGDIQILVYPATVAENPSPHNKKASAR